ncbi:hypothetical protein RchiOBHm_Chr2g0173851 [Rosa chinensis]|uniref:Uncharacterized protein n=1 Tax=Rosa chinensis TaxID=74649 RepID=A0A2P6S600_ROSCH|nr:hypothetical protein RchiOBHm_Chr2g0173851 [Rosa chinensis]
MIVPAYEISEKLSQLFLFVAKVLSTLVTTLRERVWKWWKLEIKWKGNLLETCFGGDYVVTN